MAEYIERQAAIDLFYPVDPENDGSDGCTVVYKTENYTSDEIEAVISGLPAADVAPGTARKDYRDYQRWQNESSVLMLWT